MGADGSSREGVSGHGYKDRRFLKHRDGAGVDTRMMFGKKQGRGWLAAGWLLGAVAWTGGAEVNAPDTLVYPDGDRV